MARFYDTGIFRLPGWALEILYKCIEPLRAEEATWQTNGARTALLKNEEYSKQMRRWQDIARPIREIDPTVSVAPEAAAWFAANGIPHRVVSPSQE